MTALIADDSAAVRERLAALLSEVDGVDIVQARDGAAAMRIAREHQPEVVILDLYMPRVSGFEVLRRMRRAKMRALKIVLTNYDQPQYRDECRRLGAQFFLDKAGEFQRLVEIVRAQATRGRRR
jgi:two-component system response regulator EvgA